MKTFLYSLVFSLIIALGLFGLLSSILDNPTALLVQLLIVAVIVAIGLFLFRRLAESTGGGDQSRYRRAARQSIRRHKMASRKGRGFHPSNLKVISTGSRLHRETGRQSSKDQSYLTVIDGKKNKKKKRVLF